MAEFQLTITAVAIAACLATRCDAASFQEYGLTTAQVTENSFCAGSLIGTVLPPDPPPYTSTIVRIDTGSGQETQLGMFSDEAGGIPICASNMVYGASVGDAIYSIDPRTGVYAVVHSFPVGTEPLALTYDGGSLYGSTGRGGTGDSGFIFQMNPATGATTVLYNFPSNPSGFYADNLLVNAGILYGSTINGGEYRKGLIFKLDLASGAETTLHSFAKSEGSLSYGLTFFKNRLYGTLSSGGVSHFGAVFSLDIASGGYQTLHAFGHRPDGQYPYGKLIAYQGELYGATGSGGSAGYGTLYQINPETGVESVVHSFGDGSAAGKGPLGGPQLHAGTFYGVTLHGGSAGEGTVYEFTLGLGDR